MGELGKAVKILAVFAAIIFALEAIVAFTKHYVYKDIGTNIITILAEPIYCQIGVCTLLHGKCQICP